MLRGVIGTVCFDWYECDSCIYTEDSDQGCAISGQEWLHNLSVDGETEEVICGKFKEIE